MLKFAFFYKFLCHCFCLQPNRRGKCNNPVFLYTHLFGCIFQAAIIDYGGCTHINVVRYMQAQFRNLLGELLSLCRVR